MNIFVNKMKLEVKGKLKKMEDMMKPVDPLFSEYYDVISRSLNLQQKVDEFEDQEKQYASQFRKVKMHSSMPKEQVVNGKINIQKYLDIG